LSPHKNVFIPAAKADKNEKTPVPAICRKTDENKGNKRAGREKRSLRESCFR
jgi:hypothetical protein